jgi:hypothetical protein
VLFIRRMPLKGSENMNHLERYGRYVNAFNKK